MAEPLADGPQADAPVNHLGGVAVAKLVDGADDASQLTVVRPALLDRLIADRATVAILRGPEEEAALVAHHFQVGPQLLQQARIVNQDRALPPAFSDHGQPLVVTRQVQVLDVGVQRLTDAQAGLEDEALYARIAERLPSGVGDKLDALLTVDQKETRSDLFQMKEYAPDGKAKNIVEYLDRYGRILQTGIEAVDWTGIPSGVRLLCYDGCWCPVAPAV